MFLITKMFGKVEVIAKVFFSQCTCFFFVNKHGSCFSITLKQNIYMCTVLIILLGSPKTRRINRTKNKTCSALMGNQSLSKFKKISQRLNQKTQLTRYQGYDHPPLTDMKTKRLVLTQKQTDADPGGDPLDRRSQSLGHLYRLQPPSPSRCHLGASDF